MMKMILGSALLFYNVLQYKTQIIPEAIYDNIKLKNVLKKYDKKGEDDGDLRVKTCHFIIKEVLFNKEDDMTRSMGAITELRIEARYIQMNNICMRQISKEIIYQIESSINDTVDYQRFRDLVYINFNEESNIKNEEEIMKIQKEKEKWEYIKFHLIVIGFFLFVIVVILSIVYIKQLMSNSMISQQKID